MDSTQKLNILLLLALLSLVTPSFTNSQSLWLLHNLLLQLPKLEIYYNQKLSGRNLSNIIYILTLQRCLSCFPETQTHYTASDQSGNIPFLISLITLNGFCEKAVKKKPPL